MVVYVVINEQSKDGVVRGYLIGVYNSYDLAYSKYMEYVDSGRYSIIPMLMDRTIVDAKIYAYTSGYEVT